MSEVLDKQISKEYEYGFSTNVEAYTLPPGLDESVIAKISQFNKMNSKSDCHHIPNIYI